MLDELLYNEELTWYWLDNRWYDGGQRRVTAVVQRLIDLRCGSRLDDVSEYLLRDGVVDALFRCETTLRKATCRAMTSYHHRYSK